jgi:hypothetical protein
MLGFVSDKLSVENFSDEYNSPFLRASQERRWSFVSERQVAQPSIGLPPSLALQ